MCANVEILFADENRKTSEMEVSRKSKTDIYMLGLLKRNKQLTAISVSIARDLGPVYEGIWRGR